MRKDPSLDDWARRLFNSLINLRAIRIGAHHHYSPTSVARYFNEASLILFLSGDIDRARDLCSRSIDLYLEMAAESDETSRSIWLSMAIQPYINIGRIHSALGNTETALDFFQNIYLFSIREGTLVLADKEITSPEIYRIEEHDSSSYQKLRDVCRNSYIFDSSTALFLARKYDQLLSFIDAVEESTWMQSSDPNIQRVKAAIVEIKIRALIELGEYSHALALSRSLYESYVTNGLVNPGVLLLIPRAYRLSLRMTLARRNLDTISNVLSSADKEMTYSQTWYMLALEELACGRRSQSFEINSSLAERSLVSDDRSVYIKALIGALASVVESPYIDRRSSDGIAVYCKLHRGLRETLLAVENSVGYLTLALAHPAISPETSNSAWERYRLLSKSVSLFDSVPFISVDKLKVLAQGEIKRYSKTTSMVQEIRAFEKREFRQPSKSNLTRLYDELMLIGYEEVKALT